MKELIDIFLDKKRKNYDLPYKYNDKLIAFDKNMVAALRLKISDCDYTTKHYADTNLNFKKLDTLHFNSTLNISLEKLNEGIKTARLMPKKDRKKVVFSFENKYPTGFFTLKQVKKLQKTTKILAKSQIKALSIGYSQPCLFKVANAEVFLLSSYIDNIKNYIIISI